MEANDPWDVTNLGHGWQDLCREAQGIPISCVGLMVTEVSFSSFLSH